MRNLTKTLAVVSLLASTDAHTLGIGEIKLHSALNQQLNAEISLSLSGENLSDIKVNLAPQEKFTEAGVSWNSFLSAIHFETVSHDNGSAIIRLTSKEALKEPFLDFLLEVSWPKGNLYREFTVLVDPPVTSRVAVAPVGGATTTVSTDYSTISTPGVSQLSHAGATIDQGEYGPTLSSDTLWSVASRVRGNSDISVEQMMVAIYEANPNAFYKGNMHGLIANKILKIPGRESISKWSKNQAIAEFNKHTKQWRTRSAPSVEIVKDETKDKAASNTTIDNQLTLLPPGNKETINHIAEISQNNKTHAVENGKTDELEPAMAPAGGALSNKVISSAPPAETLPSNNATNASVDTGTLDKIAALEKQLAMMQELIVLKDKQLAELQQQVQPQTQTVAVAPKLPAPSPSSPSPSSSQSAKPLPAATNLPATSAIQVKQGVNWFYWGAVGSGTVLLGLLGWLVWRKRKIDEKTNTESMFATAAVGVEVLVPSESISVPLVDDAATRITSGTLEESSFLSEFTSSDFDSFDTDQGEIDPISEADVYLAYGRYQQAEELIRQAIKDQPDRDECKLKLLEIFYANENVQAFEEYANELVAAGRRKDAAFWAQVAEMGKEICPNSHLFSSDKSIADDRFDELALSLETDYNSLDFDLHGSSALEEELEESEQQKNREIEFELSSFSMDSEEAEKGVIASVPQLNKSFKIQTDELADNEGDSEFDEAEKGVIATNAILGKSEKRSAESYVNEDLTQVNASSVEEDELFDLSLSDATAEKNPAVESYEFELNFNDGKDSQTLEYIDFNLSEESGIEFSDDNLISQLDEDQLKTPKKSDLEFDSYQFDLELDESLEPIASKNNGFHELALDTDKQQQSSIDNVDELEFSFRSILKEDDNKSLEFDFSENESSDKFNFDFDLELSSSGEADDDQYGDFSVSDLTDMDELETKLDLAKAYVDMGDEQAAREIAEIVIKRGNEEQQKTARALLSELN